MPGDGRVGGGRGVRGRRVRPGGALTRSSVRRGASGRARREDEEAPNGSRLGRLWRSPAGWIVGVLLVVATTTFQDVLGATIGAILPLDRVPDRVSPAEAIDVITVRPVREAGTWLVRDANATEIDGALADGSWTDALDLVDVGAGQWVVTIEGRAQQRVRITDIVPELVGGGCAEPLSGPLVLTQGEGGGPVIQLTVTIDDPLPRLHGTTEAGEDTGPYFTGPSAQHVTLDHNETVAFLLGADAERGHCRWTYRVHYEVAGEGHTMTLAGPGGQPFEITAAQADPADYPVVYFSPQGCARDGGFSERRLRGTGEDYARALTERDGAPSGTPVGCPEHLRE
ncbi:hypothetical protein [Streptomyces profundus]|uniref:hypothetical protein n=1 Tax=Streptomyces profundus TaxID=2867410 RepID=UPI001D15F9B7|nr:hypothetical protein [Streptomyces sp. MA3_2.13]UED84099.1 hypothetical protein K4G22_07665 [Streptomyces sp. MA3_2.13]